MLAPGVYNQAITDAQGYLTDGVAGLSGSAFEAEVACCRLMRAGV